MRGSSKRYIRGSTEWGAPHLYRAAVCDNTISLFRDRVTCHSNGCAMRKQLNAGSIAQSLHEVTLISNQSCIFRRM